MPNKIFSNDLSGDAPCTPLTWEVGYEFPFLFDRDPYTFHRSVGIQEHTLLFDYGTPTPVKGVSVINHNIPPGDTLFFEASNDNFVTAPAQSQALTTLSRTVSIKQPDGKREKVTRYDSYCLVDWNYQYYRLRMQKTTGYFHQIALLYIIGDAYTFERNYNWGYTRTNNVQFQQPTPYKRKWKSSHTGFDFSFEGITDTQRETFGAIAENDAILYHDSDKDTLYYGHVDFSTYTHVYTNFWDTTMNFREVR